MRKQVQGTCVSSIAGRAAAAAILTGLLGAAVALGQQDGPSEREQELEHLIRELLDRVSHLESRLEAVEKAGSGGGAKPPAPLDTRVEELEKTVAEIKTVVPPDAESEEWARWREVMDEFSSSNTLRSYWKDGLRFDSLDGSFKLKIGGRIQHDWAFYDADDDIEGTVGSLDDGTEFRRARIYMSGTIYDKFDFKIQYDFAGGDSDFKDVYLGARDVPWVGNVRVGHFKEPFSLEELTSSNYITFMERSLVNAFAPSRNAGFMIFDDALDQRLTWAAGFFRETDDFGEGSVGRDYNVTARLTGLPWYEDEGRKLLHLGVSYTHKNFEDDMVRFRDRPESHQAPRFVDTGDFEAEYADLVGGEIALVHGSFSLQGEYVQAFVESRTMSDPVFWAASVQASYFLTGEHRPYNRSAGTFGRIRPIRNVGEDGGWGAWELAARYSHLDLNDGSVTGGELRDFTFGLNWYLNPNMRIMWNYVRADLTGDDGDADIFQMRFQVNF